MRLNFRNIFLFAKEVKEGIYSDLRANCSCGSLKMLVWNKLSDSRDEYLDRENLEPFGKLRTGFFLLPPRVMADR